MVRLDALSRWTLALVVVHVALPSVLGDAGVILVNFSHNDHLSFFGARWIAPTHKHPTSLLHETRQLTTARPCRVIGATNRAGPIGLTAIFELRVCLMDEWAQDEGVTILRKISANN
jgi:hypothetical protein